MRRSNVCANRQKAGTVNVLRARSTAYRLLPLDLDGLRERFGAWVSAEAATLFAALDERGFERILLALDATAADVFSFLAMVGSYEKG